MRRLVLAFRLALGGLAYGLYVWYSAVTAVGRAKRRKAARRASRQAGRRHSGGR